MADRTLHVTADGDLLQIDTVVQLAEILGDAHEQTVPVEYDGRSHDIPDPRRVLSGFREVLATVHGEIGREVWLARAAGMSWTEIGTALGITKQGAQQRYGAAAQRKSPY